MVRKRFLRPQWIGIHGYVTADAGARAFAKSKGMLDQYQWISSDGDSSKQLSQIKSILARPGPCTVLNVDANESAIVPSIVKEVEKSGAWVVAQGNKPDGTSPRSSGKHWVAHMSVDGVPQGYGIAKALFEEMGGRGNIVALQGVLDNPPQGALRRASEGARVHRFGKVLSGVCSGKTSLSAQDPGSLHSHA